jgi:hypothetical protein
VFAGLAEQRAKLVMSGGVFWLGLDDLAILRGRRVVFLGHL